mmetsp:Transcript_44516/g.105495  ORF Transcript_44516/g.105495 Transcript_44516/m.105495 type:complete len:234 (+) Transcript_44516:102-803(+)|eukprot:CAMPEP_0178407468 /NCGR_PEP_ID=MMETSP0689_2-20121128/19445_1 /TAXON_ID=160604 /ORGANISM="Amphidinium massartii, Strain CS-259" /LENGTH=233 /DNA_ID=CAMNT_0020028545 /DNA_START=102 /DNA_END=803 /DNA_ORIENTATION=+
MSVRPLLRLALSWACLQACQALNKDAVAHLECQVCQVAVEEAKHFAAANSIVDEDGLADLVDGICSVKKKEGRWNAKYDIVSETSGGGWFSEKSETLGLERQEGMSHCRNECLHIQRACSNALKRHEEKLVALLLEKASTKDIRKKVCKKVCSKDRKLPKLTGWTDEPFDARDAKEVETEDLVESMKAATGMGMKMYKREDLLTMSEGDMEVMAAREAYAQERQAARMEDGDL